MVPTIGTLQAEIDAGKTPDATVAEAVERAAADTANAFTEVREGAFPRPGSLEGIPIALKDLIDEAGSITTAGSSFYRHQPSESAPVVARLEQAGATIIGRTGLHEFAYGFSSENDWFGPVRNPWDLDTSPGGSSGGSAAAVAAGIVPAAIGTDTGGSVRVPAALCGIMGLKVSHGAVPLTGVLPLAESLDTIGPIARTVDDLEAVFLAMAGYDASDPWSRRLPAQEAPPALAELSIGVPVEWLAAVPTEPAIRDGFAGFLDALRELGATVVEIHDEELVPSPHIVTLSAAEAARVHRAWFTDVEKAYGAEVEQRLADAMEVTTDQLGEARRWQALMVRQVTEAFTRCDVLVTPTVGAMRKTIGVDHITIDGTDHFYRPILSGFSALVNQVWCPALAAPLDVDGAPPPSVQLVGPWGSDLMLTAIGRQLEAAGLIGSRIAPHSQVG